MAASNQGDRHLSFADLHGGPITSFNSDVINGCKKNEPLLLDADFDDVSLLVHFDGANGATSAPDFSNFNHTLTFVSPAELDTSEKVFGTASLLTDGAGARVEVADSDAFNLGGGNFTLEGFFTWATDVNDRQDLIGQNSPASQQSYLIIRDGVPNNLVLMLSSMGTDFITKITAPFTVVLGQKYHIATDFNGTTYRLYVDGDVIGTAGTPVTLHNSTAAFSIGARVAGGAKPFDGHIDDVRLTKGVARYQGAFTRPTEAFPDSEFSTTESAITETNFNGVLFRWLKLKGFIEPVAFMDALNFFAFFQNLRFWHNVGRFTNVDWILLEDGTFLLQENGQGIFQEF